MVSNSNAITDLEPLVDPNDFVGLDGICNLAAAGETPMLSSQKSLFEQFMHDKSRGMGGRERIYSKVASAADSLAALLSCSPGEIGFPLNVAQAMNSVARSVSNTSGNVVACQWEFPSALYPWITGSDLEVKTITNTDYLMDAEQFADAVTPETVAIVVSLVSYFTGERIDLETFREIADSCGAMLVVDMSHALGVGAFDVTLADFAFSCGYKWILGTHGAGIAYCNSNRQEGWTAHESGWTSAEWRDATVRGKDVVPLLNGRRFELGNPSALSVQILGNGVDYIRGCGLDAISQHVLALTGALWEGLTERGLRVLTPESSTKRLGIVSFAVEDEKFWRDGLESRGVFGWVGDQRVRLSPHLYNGTSDVQRTLEAVDAINKMIRRS